MAKDLILSAKAELTPKNWFLRSRVTGLDRYAIRDYEIILLLR